MSNEGWLSRLNICKQTKLRIQTNPRDKILPWFLKLTADQISQFLTDIFQTSIDSGKILYLWNEAYVTPVV